jgi:SAM-dependent methyltransferase
MVYHSSLSLSDLFSRKRKDETADAGADSPVYPTKALAKFLASLNARSQRLLLDLGPVVGTNVTFFGEELGCKIHVEDVFKDIDRHVNEGKLDVLPSFLAKRFAQEDGTVDGILCWDIFDYLDKASAQVLARELIRMLRPDGVLFALFNIVEAATKAPPGFTRYVVVDRQNLQYRSYRSARGKQRPLTPRDIQRLFEPLHISEQFLLKNNLREVLFRKPSIEKATAEGKPASHRAAD